MDSLNNESAKRDGENCDFMPRLIESEEDDNLFETERLEHVKRVKVGMPEKHRDTMEKGQRHKAD